MVKPAPTRFKAGDFTVKIMEKVDPSTQASTAIPFKDILGAQLGHSYGADPEALDMTIDGLFLWFMELLVALHSFTIQCVSYYEFMISRPRAPIFSQECGANASRPRRAVPGTFPFTVRTQGKRLRLEAEEEQEAFQWISMLQLRSHQAWTS